MNSCPRCDGLLVEEWDEGEYFHKCINCGGIMPRFKTEEDRLAWVEKCNATRARNRGLKPVGKMAVPILTPSRLPVVVKHNGHGNDDLLATLVSRIDEKILELETAKAGILKVGEVLGMTP